MRGWSWLVPGLLLTALYSCSSDSEEGGSANNGGTANGTGSGGSANGTGSGGSTAGSGNGGGANGTGVSFCVVGQRGCICDAAQNCASGLVCNNNTCCDGSDCSALPVSNGTVDGGAGTGGNGTGATSSGDAGTCVPGAVGPFVTDCGYPYESSNPLTSVVFNESTVLRGIEPSGGVPLASVRLFYNDEHALTLGVRRVEVIDSTGTASQDYPVTPLTTNPSSANFPQTGTNEVTGDYSGLDQSGRPMWPVLYITDITDDPNNRSGDWQMGGTAYNPNVIFGSWKAAVRTVDKTVTPNVVSVTPDPDPATNDWNLGGGDPVPDAILAMKNEGYSAEVRWDVVLLPGRSYRLQVMVHDGDQNKVGGDSGEACVDFCAAEACPSGAAACVVSVAQEDLTCPTAQGMECVNGCCLAGALPPVK